MKKSTSAKAIFSFGLIFCLFSACKTATLATPVPLVITRTAESPSSTASLPPSTSTPTLPPTLTATLNAWEETLVAVVRTGIVGTHGTEGHGAQKYAATSTAQTPTALANRDCSPASPSPDKKWLFTNCSDRDNPTLVLQNQQKKKWTLEFRDFLSADAPEETTGTLQPVFWSWDGKYLYFTVDLPWEGGGDQCFPGHWDGYGLFRLDLRTGVWVTLVPPKASFPGYAIRFSPDGRNYATDADGVRIADLQTGLITTFSISGTVQDLSWSPDGLHLAYSVASCGKQGVESSSVYIWDAATNDAKQVLFAYEGILFKPEAWSGNSILRIKGEKQVGSDTLYTVYVYDLAQHNVIFDGTATPSH